MYYILYVIVSYHLLDIHIILVKKINILQKSVIKALKKYNVNYTGIKDKL